MVPKQLTTRHLLHRDIGNAAEEAIQNALRLVLAGYPEAAHRICSALLARGPWKLSAKSHLQWQVWQLVYLLQARYGLTVPDSAHGPGQWLEPAQTWLADLPGGLGHMLGFGEVPDPLRTWTPTQLAELLASVQVGAFGTALNHARDSIERALRHRVLAWRPYEQVPSAPPGVPTDHGALADLFETTTRIAFPRDLGHHAASSALAAAAIDIFQGHWPLAVARLGRVLPKAEPATALAFIAMPTFADWLRTKALASSLGLKDAGVEAYLAAFRGRSPAAIAEANKPRPWKAVLKEFTTWLEEDGVDADTLVGTVEAGTPGCKALLARARRGKALNTPCPAEAIAALEARIGLSLPPSYREFLAVSDGMVTPAFAILPAAQVERFAVLDPDSLSTWMSDPTEASDEEYSVYGADQDCVHMRPRHLADALQVSTNLDADVLLLVPGVRFGEEWEAWFLGAKNPGAYRYRSFRDLMEQCVLCPD